MGKMIECVKLIERRCFGSSSGNYILQSFSYHILIGSQWSCDNKRDTDRIHNYFWKYFQFCTEMFVADKYRSVPVGWPQTAFRVDVRWCKY